MVASPAALRDRIESKLPELMTSGSTAARENFNEYRRLDYQLRQLKKKNPALYNHHINSINKAVQDLKSDLVEEEEIVIEWGPRAVIREFERQQSKRA